MTIVMVLGLSALTASAYLDTFIIGDSNFLETDGSQNGAPTSSASLTLNSFTETFATNATTGFEELTLSFDYIYDMSSYGGSATESVSFDVLFQSSHGDVVYYDSTSAAADIIGLDGSSLTDDLGIDGSEVLWATVSNVVTTNTDIQYLGYSSVTVAGSGAWTDSTNSRLTAQGGIDLSSGAVAGSYDYILIDQSAITPSNASTFSVRSEDTALSQGVSYYGIQFGVVPEPSSAALLGLGGLALISRRKR